MADDFQTDVSLPEGTNARWLRAVVETAVDGVILIDASGRVLMFNPACEKLFKYRSDEVVGQNVKMLMPGHYRQEHDRYLDNFAKTGKRKIIGSGREVLGQRKDGSTFPMDLSVGEAKQDDGSIFVGIIHDLTERERAEQALRESAARLKAVVDTAVDGVILIDARGRIIMFNPACERLFQYSVDEVMHENVKLLMPSSYRIEHDGYIRNFLDSGERKIIGIGREVVGQRKDGSTFPMNLSVGEAKQDGESIFVGIIHDLTERKRAEQSVHDSERSFRLLVEGVADYAIYTLDLEGRVTSWNSGAERIKQFTAAEILGRHVREFYTEDERLSGEPERNLETVRREGRYEVEAWRVRKDGSKFWASVVVDAITNEQGQLLGYAKITRDISERRRAEQAIHDAGMRISTVVQTAVDGVIWIDAAGLIQMFNPACEKLFGYLAEEVFGQNVKILMPAPYRDEHDRYLDNFHRTGLKKIIGSGREVVGRRKDGSTFPMDLSVGEAKQDGKSIFVGIIHDLTERKRTEEQLVQAQKMEMVGQLSGGIAHDFNNLLTVIVGNAEFLSEQLKPRQDLRQLANDIGRAGDRGAELTQRLLAFSRRQILRPIEIDSNQLLDGMQKMLRRALREDIEINTSFDPGLALAYADPAQLESAVLNLAVNAQDAMASGGRLTITTANASLDDHYKSLHPEVMPGEYIMVAVTDDGEGMPKNVLERVFEPFFTTKEVGKGSGLGLSMVYGFVKQSSGHVSIYSEPGLGTTVRIYLPQVSAKLPTSSGPTQMDEALLPKGTETVLVVEDDPFVRSYAVMRLQSLGYSVVAAVDGKDALDKLRTDIRVDVLFTDIVMPGGINGWNLAELAQQMRPGLPVLLTSGYALETLIKHGRHREGAVVLTKPYRKADLALRLREVLKAPPPVTPSPP
ncbi:PAS domain S-box protein [Bradyrhizobium sp. OK095]|uniref:hybrid sensor histidine kinase/response regulator n=1 Tax=Bradyrhizobium sp. OK095 TaxID=1882760 RepID=UPI0008B7C780|nr:PAS domain S-box protein [Bradyrhizobium sp. OK095]SEO11062.1 PAS domain S-box-containing protein [Bradyrhizobium sp. OK095]